MSYYYQRQREWGSLLPTQKKRGKWHGSFHSSIFELCSPSCLLPFSWLAAMFFFPKSLQMVIFIVIIIIYRLIFSPSSVQQHKNILRWEEISSLIFEWGGGGMCTCNCQMDAPDVAICRASFSTHKKENKNMIHASFSCSFDWLNSTDINMLSTISPSC